MGRSAGTGSPVWFRCFRDRRGDYHPPGSTVELTGRERGYGSKRGSAMGSRSTHISREYRCSCGYVGWSNHVDLCDLAGSTREQDREKWRALR